MWKGTRGEALEAVRSHIANLRKEGLNVLADALEHIHIKVSRCESMEHFEVQGAGEIEVSRSESHTGTANGPHIGVSWGTWGYAGGVLDRGECHRLIAHLLSVIGDEPVVRELR